jgi:hypothetical protein
LVRATIFLHLRGKRFTSGQDRELELLGLTADAAILRDDFSDNGKAFYRLSDGRRLDQAGTQVAPWDFWRLDVPRLREELRQAGEVLR